MNKFVAIAPAGDWCAILAIQGREVSVPVALWALDAHGEVCGLICGDAEDDDPGWIEADEMEDFLRYGRCVSAAPSGSEMMAMLVKLEWAGPDAASGLATPRRPTCILCGGIKPEAWDSGYPRSSLGHRDACSFAGLRLP